MTLRLQINLIVGALTVLFTAAVLWLQLASLRESVHEETAAANRVAAQLLNRTALRYAAQGAPTMLAFLQGVGRIRSNDITLYDAKGNELYRSPPSPYKAGRDAPAWFEALMVPPPAVQSIQFPDGRLEVRANASRAALDAWDYMVNLVAAALALLVVIHVLVFWLVGRAVKPFGRIVHALEQLRQGRFDVALPRLRGTEAGAIGAAFNRMLAQLQAHIETERRAVRAELQLSDSRELTRWIDQQIEHERRAIARELHDELGQSVTAMRSMALSIAQRVSGSDAEAERAARIIADESSRLYDAMHGIIPRLTPLVLDNFGLAEALDGLLERTRRSQPAVKISQDVNLAAAPLPPDVALALFRAAQEGITNALRHGEPSELALRVEGTPTHVSLALRDDGRGLAGTDADAGTGGDTDGGKAPAAAGSGAPARVGHHGLRWLTERVQGLGGELRIEPNTPRGVCLSVRIPLAGVPA